MTRKTLALAAEDVAKRVSQAVPSSVEGVEGEWTYVQPDKLLDVARFVHDSPDLDGRFLASLSGVDRYDAFEVVYHLASLSHNHTFILKVRADHERPEVPSVSSIWLGAHLQEREAFDLLGIVFAGHPDMKRLFLWEGFPGHPLRKDFMTLPQGFSPGLRRFPKENPDSWAGEAHAD
jgi:NADH-quinone oxidoreductase subunit C